MVEHWKLYIHLIVYNVFGLWLSDGFILPPDGTDSPKQSVCTSDDTPNVYPADI
jgi:hypothetical protein